MRDFSVDLSELAKRAQDARAYLHIEEARERLFSTFYRIPGRCGTKGAGLGLALVRQIARRHGGDVAYNPERGSSFTVTLPARA